MSFSASAAEHVVRGLHLRHALICLTGATLKFCRKARCVWTFVDVSARI
jgi:hypothetical protein